MSTPPDPPPRPNIHHDNGYCPLYMVDPFNPNFAISLVDVDSSTHKYYIGQALVAMRYMHSSITKSSSMPPTPAEIDSLPIMGYIAADRG